MISLQSERLLAFHWSRVLTNISSIENFTMLTFYMALTGVQPSYKRSYGDPLVQGIFKPRTPQEVVLFSRLEPAMERLTQVLRVLLSTRQEDATLEHFCWRLFLYQLLERIPQYHLLQERGLLPLSE